MAAHTRHGQHSPIRCLGLCREMRKENGCRNISLLLEVHRGMHGRRLETLISGVKLKLNWLERGWTAEQTSVGVGYAVVYPNRPTDLVLTAGTAGFLQSSFTTLKASDQKPNYSERQKLQQEEK